MKNLFENVEQLSSREKELLDLVAFVSGDCCGEPDYDSLNHIEKNLAEKVVAATKGEADDEATLAMAISSSLSSKCCG